MAHGEQLQNSAALFETQSAEFISTQAQRTREYVASQLEDWQQLPLLALMANGKNGWSGELGNISENGVVRVGSGMHFADNPEQRPSGLYGMYVDCDNGNLLRLRGVNTPITAPESIANDEEVFHLWATKSALGKLGILNAKLHIAELKDLVNEPLGLWRSLDHEHDRQVQVKRQIARRGLGTHFVRN